jgi:hypothetical protein
LLLENCRRKLSAEVKGIAAELLQEVFALHGALKFRQSVFSVTQT